MLDKIFTFFCVISIIYNLEIENWYRFQYLIIKHFDQNNKSKSMRITKIKTLSFLLLMVFGASQAIANETTATQTLETVKVKGKRVNPSLERKNQEAIRREMINDTRDLVRYSADVGISDDGRRTKGFAMRGVEENRVGISIDGVSLPESEENSLYARYGNFNNSRLSIDPELVRSIEVNKGADSINSGSGALGGNVNYRTLNGSDLLRDNRTLGSMFKSGYASKNREWVNTLGVGFNNGTVDVALLYSHRHGHELKSNGGDVELYKPNSYATEYDIQRFAEVGSSRIKPDPSQHKNNSWLAKLGWQINPNHRVGVSVNGQKSNNYIHEYSYAMNTSWREADDVQKRINGNLFYEYTPESQWLALLRADIDHQKTDNGSINYKGDYDSTKVNTGNWRTDYYRYDKSWTSNRDFRNNETKLNRFGLRMDSQPLQWGKTTHELSMKLLAGQRQFKNVNTDENLDRQGKVTKTDIYTIQYPVKTNQYRIALSDKFRLTDRLSGHIGVAYDYYKIKPSEPDGIPCGKDGGFGRLCSGTPVPASFKDWSFTTGLNWKFNPNWQAGYNFATGFRVPTASEMYFTFESVYGSWLANPKLTSERSQNHTLFLQGRGEKGSLDLSVYQSRYRDFLYEQETNLTREDPTCDEFAAYYTGCTGKRTDYFQQMVNLDKARVNGVEISGSLNLDKISPLPQGWKLSSSLGYSKGSMNIKEGKLSMLSIQPLKFVLGLDYEQPAKKYGVFSRLTYTGAKKAKDAQTGEYATRCLGTISSYSGRCIGTEEAYTKIIDYRFLNKRAWVFDVFGYYRPTQNLTLRAGVYNLFNTKYHTWDSLRGINMRSTINSISLYEYSRGNLQGLERYYAPGRNYAVSLEYKF